MADPLGANMTEAQARAADAAGGQYGKGGIELGLRVAMLRSDLDGVEAGDASTTAVLAALAAADGNVDVNDQRIDNCAGVTADGGETFTIVCETGQDAELTASTGTKISWNQTGVSFFDVATVAQPDTNGTETGFTAGSGAAVKVDSSFTGDFGSKAYTLGDIVLALKQLGIMAKDA